MKNGFSLFIGLFLLFSCHQNDTEKKVNINRDKLQNQDTIVSIQKSQNETQTLQESVSGTFITPDIIQEYADYPDIIKNHLADFYTFDLTSFNCSEIEAFSDNIQGYNYTHNDVNKLKPFTSIDSIDYKECKAGEEVLNLNDYYLLSVEKPILGYFPITVFSYGGVAESPMYLILFDKKGHFVNGIEVADFYGEAESGCLDSYFVNDSTLVREYQWDELDENENMIENAHQMTEKLVIHKDGSFTIVESKSDEDLKNDQDLNTTDPELYLVKDYSHLDKGKDTLVKLDYFDNPEVLDNIRFEYAKLLLNETDTTDSNTLKIYNKIDSFVFKRIKFDAAKHNIKIIDSTYELLVDGKHAYGTDGFVDCLKWEFDTIKIKVFGKHIQIPKKYYANYFNPNLSKNDIDIYELPHDRMIIRFSGGDAACSYRAALFFKDNKIIKSIAVAGD